MQAVISLMPGPYTTRIKQIWDTLQRALWAEISALPQSALYLAVGRGYKEEDVITLLHGSQRLGPSKSEPRPESLRRKSPVLFIEVHKSPRLKKIHSLIWSQFSPSPLKLHLSTRPSWHPHITLAMKTLQEMRMT